jgi:hypothetical protein
MRGKAFSEMLLAVITLAVVSGNPGRVEAVPASRLEPQVFGQGTLSVGEIYRGCFTPDGRAFYFFKKVTSGQEDYRIFVSHQLNGEWGQPAQVRLGGEYSDLYPAISKDGKRMVFSSYRPAPGDTAGKPNARLWYVEREGGGWGAPVFLTAVNKAGHYHSWVKFGPGGALYFRRTTPDWNSTEHRAPRLPLF